ncbi:Hypothetical predicted protein [Cloeon dipterum]|uniref:SRCR domain-containing protein n=1 Tax=Cloeon dipterum TaxID=197152 RepID=A0A8S1DR03_9INSE|nr:Hypothetical predicted protein [Cloeon dipterum]
MMARKLFLILNLLTIYSVSTRAQDENPWTLTIKVNGNCKNVRIWSNIMYQDRDEQRWNDCNQNNTSKATIVTCITGVSNISVSVIPQTITTFKNHSNESVECQPVAYYPLHSQNEKDDEILIKCDRNHELLVGILAIEVLLLITSMIICFLAVVVIKGLSPH